MSVHVSVDVLSEGAAYLWDPPSNSWVSSFASLFFILGLLVASPMFFLLALDFTSYAIVRTLGIEHAHPVSSKSTLTISTTTSDPPSSSSTPSPGDTHLSILSGTKVSKTSTSSSSGKHHHHHHLRPSNISIPSNQSLTLDQVQPFFTTPGGGSSANPNLDLSGLFSPPESRTPSPPGSSFIHHLDHQGGDERGGGATPRAEEGPVGKGYAFATGHARIGDTDASAKEGDDAALLRRRKPAPAVPESSQ